jgi:hypothetical protein
MRRVQAHDDRFWNRLLRAIEEGQVVPIVGPQVLAWGEPDNPQTLQRLVAEELLQARGVDVSALRLTFNRELPDAVAILKRDVNLQELYGDVSDRDYQDLWRRPAHPVLS